MGYVIGLGLQITELKILFQSDISSKSGKSTALATTIFLLSVFFFFFFMYCMHKIENKCLWKDELTVHNWQKLKRVFLTCPCH